MQNPDCRPAASGFGICHQGESSSAGEKKTGGMAKPALLADTEIFSIQNDIILFGKVGRTMPSKKVTVFYSIRQGIREGANQCPTGMPFR